MRIWFAPVAKEDLTQACARLELIDVALAERFLDEFDNALERMTMFPHGAPPVDGFPGVRRARLRRFRYGVFYRVVEKELQVVRILHAKQDRSALHEG